MLLTRNFGTINLEMLRFFVSLLILLSPAALASPASVLVAQYLEFVTKYHVDAEELNAASLKTRLETMLKSRCGADATCPTTRVYDDLKTITRTLPDQTSSFLSPVDLLRLNTETKRYSLGLEIRGDIVYRVLNGSSAATQGVKRGDKVRGVTREGLSVPLNALSFTDAKPVTVTLEREGKPVPVTLTPALNLQSALLNPESALLENSIGYVRIPSFRAPDTAQRVHSLVSALQSRNPKGLLIDLRFNTGGYLDQALLTLGAFLEDGAVLGLESRTASVTYSLRAGGVEVAQGEGVNASRWNSPSNSGVASSCSSTPAPRAPPRSSRWRCNAPERASPERPLPDAPATPRCRSNSTTVPNCVSP
ncbi:MAG: hypothetical protein HC933_06265 [Pleurocapsa sp. SU_196_0]|nr:hypothetical protein [Pleurocapsa sp. SU_196_0]